MSSSCTLPDTFKGVPISFVVYQCDYAGLEYSKEFEEDYKLQKYGPDRSCWPKEWSSKDYMFPDEFRFDQAAAEVIAANKCDNEYVSLSITPV